MYGNMQEEINSNPFNKGIISRPSKYQNHDVYKNLHKAALKAKEFLDYGIESKKKYKRLRKEALDVLDYFSKTVNRFYAGKLPDEQFDYLLNIESKNMLKDIKSGKASGLEEKL